MPIDLTLRPITGRAELDLFTTLPYVLDAELDADLADGRRRPEWMWLALDGDRPLARLAWWSRPHDERPLLMDFLDVADVPDRLDIGERLVRAAMAATLEPGATPPEYTRYVPPDWRADDGVRRAVQDRMTILERTGAHLLVERLRLEWRPGTPLPEPTGRLVFRDVAGRDELVALMVAVLEGTLDAHSVADLVRMSPQEAAREHYDDELARFTTPRQWWRVATLPGGDPVGFVIPAHNGYNPIIAYLGVLPAHRGKGHIDDILAEGTRILAAQDVPRVRASTDVGNIPMAKAFARGGYDIYQRELNMTWSRDTPSVNPAT